MPTPLYSASVCGSVSGTVCPSPFVLTIDLSQAAVDVAVSSHPSIELLEGSSTGAVAENVSVVCSKIQSAPETQNREFLLF